MRYVTSILSMFVLLCQLSYAAEIPVPIQKGYFPPQFDEKSPISIVVTGSLANSCFHLANAAVSVDEMTNEITVEQFASESPGRCSNLIHPYSTSINVGVLRAGTYGFVDLTTGRTLGEVVVGGTEGGDDDYAPITQVEIQPLRPEESRSEGAWLIVLTGMLPDHCTKLEEVSLNYSEDVIVVKPVVERIEIGTLCQIGTVAFKYGTPIKNGTLGRYLIHVLAANGKTIDKLVDLN